MKSCSDLEFLDSYWNEAKKIAENIKLNLPNGVGENLPMLGSKEKKTIMFVIPYSKLGDSWDVQDILLKNNGRSKKLIALSEKISHMILKGDSCNVKPLIDSIINNKIKKQTRVIKDKEKNNEFLGHGHFRWNYQTYTLNAIEINRIKLFFYGREKTSTIYLNFGKYLIN